jgi:hypothetical protein
VKKTFGLGFAFGALAHLLFWLAVINLDSTPMDLECGEISCWVLIVSELPVSFFYLSGSAFDVTIGSLFVGSLWWGTVTGGVIYLAKKLRQAISQAHPEP